MSYTPPQHVDTKEQAVLALASTIADEDKSALGNGSVNRALDILADVLAQQDVQVPQTNAGAILALAQYVTGGGGGGGSVDVGALVTIIVDDPTVQVGDDFNGGGAILTVSIGGSEVAGSGGNTFDEAAAGTDVKCYIDDYDPDTPIASVMVRLCDYADYKYTYISDPIDLAVTVSVETNPYGDSTVIGTFTVPTVPSGKKLMLSAVRE